MNKTDKTLSNAHDKFFRTVMTNKRVARDFLTNHLPKEILHEIDLDNLTFQPRSYIDDIRKETIVDILYKTKIADRDGYIYLLLEHQSKPDELMPFRILKYTCNIINEHIEQTKQNLIPLIYPMVIYHAGQPYPFSTDIKDMVNAPKELVDRYFLQPFHLIDLARINDEELKKHAWAGAMEFALKHIFARDIFPYLQHIAELLRYIDQSGGRSYIAIILQYIYERAELKDQDAFFSLITTEISPDVGEKIMTLAEQMRHKGLQEGKQEGVFEEKIETAKRLLKENVELVFISRVTGLSLDRIKELQFQAETVS